MKRLQLTLGSVVILLAGCTAPAGPSATATGASAPSSSVSPLLSSPDGTASIPWSSASPVPVATSAPTTAQGKPACRADQLDIGDAGWGGATGSLLGGFLVWNTSAEACTIEGRPSIEIVDATGRQLKVAQVPDPDVAVRSIVLGPRQPVPVPHDEAAAGLASEILQWFNWCGPPPKEPLRLTVTLPGGALLGAPIVSGDGTPRCDAPTDPSQMTVAAFDETPGPAPSEPPAVPAESLTLTLDAPAQAIAGRTLQYVAILTNQTSAPIALAPCPSYMERINTKGGPVVGDYVLACSTVPVIQPGASVRFAMELALPSTLPTDDGAALVWALDPDHSEGFPPRFPAQKVAIHVVHP